MPIDIDRYIREGVELKKHGRTGVQVRAWLEAEGLDAEQTRVVLHEIGKAQLKAHAARRPAGYLYAKGFLGAGLIVSGVALLLHLWSGIEGWNVISTVPFFMMGAGLVILVSKN